MIKKCSYFIGFVLLLSILIYSFKSYEIAVLKSNNKQEIESLYYYVSTEEEMQNNQEGEFSSSAIIPFTGKTFTGFKQAIAVRESLGSYKRINSLGYMGKYQFGKSALRSVGINNTNDFLENPIKQEKAFDALLAKNKWILRGEIEKYEGKKIAGIKITESGLLAAAHLGGAGSVKKFLRTKGSVSFSDGYGTDIKSYLKKFSGYDTSHIVPNDNPIVSL